MSIISRIFTSWLLTLVNETRAIALVQSGTQANQFPSTTDRAGNITSFTENSSGKSFFFSSSRLKGVLFLHFCVCHKKRYYQENIPFVKNRYVFIKGIIGKANCYWHVRLKGVPTVSHTWLKLTFHVEKWRYTWKESVRTLGVTLWFLEWLCWVLNINKEIMRNIVCTSPLSAEWVEPPTKFSKRGGA